MSERSESNVGLTDLLGGCAVNSDELLAAEGVMKIVTSLATLFKYAGELGEAKKSGDPARIADAEKRHEAYRQMCLEADEMITGYKHGELY